MTNYYLCSEVRLHRDSEGRYRAKHSAAGYDAWAPFRDAFGKVIVVARVEEGFTSDDGPLVEGEGVTVEPLPYYAGLKQVPLGVMRVRRAFRGLGARGDVFVGRIPELISVIGMFHARRIAARRMMMLVADPSVFAQHLPRPIGTAVGSLANMLVRSLVRQAQAVSYVSQRHFQELFPPSPGIPTIGRSNVILSDGWIASAAREEPRQGTPNLISIGSLEHAAKGFDFLIRVLDDLRRRGTLARLTIVGSGRLQPDLVDLAAKLDVSVTFTGQVHDREVLKSYLDDADIYVSGSRSEGLPRASIEAMARALPVVTTDAGAAREIADPPFVTDVDDVAAFSEAVECLIQEHETYARQSRLGLERVGWIKESADPARLTEFLRRTFVN